MTRCPACAEFERNPQTGSYRAGCLECSARSVAQSPLYFNAARDPSKRAEYRDHIVSKLGLSYEDAHAFVKHYAALIEKAKVKA